MIPESAAVHAAVATLNQTVGDWAGNRARIERACAEARDRGARLLVCPEMCVPGYSLGDRVLMAGTVRRSWEMVRSLADAARGMVVTLGLPIRHDGVLYDAVVVLADGEPVAVVPKENLAVGDVEYESRWYTPWKRGRFETWTSPDGLELPIGAMVLDAEGIGPFGVEICEDGWKGMRPGALLSLAGARIVVNASASWFVVGKQRARRDLVTTVSREDQVAYLYASLLGCDATRLVFDGASFIASGGRILEEGPRFLFDCDVHVVDAVLNLAALDHERVTGGSWRQQVAAAKSGDFGPMPTRVTVPGSFVTTTPVDPPPPYWEVEVSSGPDRSLAWVADRGLVHSPLTPADIPHLELELAIALGMRDYLAKSRIPGVALALSGGRDSAMCALLVHRMLRYQHPDLDHEALRSVVRGQLVTAYLGSTHSSSATCDAAAAVADEIGAEHLTCAMQQAVDVHRELVEGMVGETLSWTEGEHDLPLQNVQARLRGSLIWFVANLRRRLLLTTSNKSEAAVGYTTMDGDTSGGIAPIADVPKSLVGHWLRWAGRFHGYECVEQVLGTPATAELRPADRAQTDEDDLMPFEVLDRLMYHFVQLGEEPLELFRHLWPELSDRYDGDARAFADHVRRFVRMLCFAQWKRERFAISFRVTAFDLDPKTGFRFPPVQEPFTEELAELEAYVATLQDES